MAQLLVSVRSASEARAALFGGASFIDVKEPLNGPLGRAAIGVRREIASLVKAHHRTLTVALGELAEWFLADSPDFGEWAAGCGSYIKLGLSHAAPRWREDWRTLRERLSLASTRSGIPSPAWVAVIYADWQEAGAPHPREVAREALEADMCAGVLIDTWNKQRTSPLDESWKPLIASVKKLRFVALAGRIDVQTIARLASLEPDIIAVRGAACTGGDRLGAVDPKRVARLADAAARISSS